MRRNLIRAVSLLAVLLPLGFFSASPVWAQTDEPREYFSQTGHWVTGEFHTTYRSQPLAEALYGYPLTDAFVDPETGYLVQFFQQAYFILYPERPAGQRVARLELGRLLYQPGLPVSLHPLTPGCVREPGWAYAICDDFHEFYIAHGGEAIFGPPISGLEIHDLIAVQYFVYGRLEFHPQRPRDHQIRIAPLGRQYFELRQKTGWVTASQLLPAVNELGLNYEISELRVDAFPQRGRIPLGESQTVIVTVRDQSRAAVSGATVSAVALLPGGSSQPLGGIVTNANGVAEFSFTPQATQVGIVEILVTVRFQELIVEAANSFRIWY